MRRSTRKRGTFWEYTVDLGNDPITNKRKRKSKSGFKTKKECETAMTLEIYSHSIPSMQNNAANNLNNLYTE